MSLVANTAPHLPYLRRFARALTGGQKSGDAYVVQRPRGAGRGPGLLQRQERSARRTVQGLLPLLELRRRSTSRRRNTSREELDDTSRRLEAITPLPRQAFLLMAVEEFTAPEIAEILGISRSGSRGPGRPGRPRDRRAGGDRRAHHRGRAADRDGHRDAGPVARPPRQRHRPHARGGDGRGDSASGPASSSPTSSWPTAVPGSTRSTRCSASFSVPVVFITAYPERLLTGERPEPAFLITKPFQPETVKAVISQALFFERRAGSH